METKFYPPTIKDGKIVAFADVDIVEGITVRGFRVVNGDNGLFAAVPSRPVNRVVNGDNGLFAAVPSRPVNVKGETRYFNQVAFADSSKRDAFLEKLLEAYACWTKERGNSGIGSPVKVRRARGCDDEQNAGC